MTPQLQQAIKLLQLSSQELEAELLEALEANPLLEREDLFAYDSGDEDGAAEADGAEGSEGLERLPSEEDAWDRYYVNMPETGARAPRREPEAFGRTQDIADRPEDLGEHLRWQLNLSHISTRDEAIGLAIIDAINDDGYLTETLEDIRASLPPDQEIDLDEVRAVLHRIQHFDPIGVGAGSVRECLQIQLAVLDAEHTPSFEIAKRIIDHHLELLARQDVPALRRRLDVSQEELKAAIDLVRSLEPRPGGNFSTGDVEYVRPDVLVERRGGRWQAILYDELSPRLRLNDYYLNLIGRASKEDARYLRGQLQEARWLIKSLETRNETLLKVANAIVSYQSGFLDHGPEAMKPLVLREVADAIDMHESTVSRVTSRKYMLTPRGIFELKYFFSSHVGTADGGECSATAIQAKIEKLIENEPPKRPLSDSKIAQILNDRYVSLPVTERDTTSESGSRRVTADRK